MPPELSRFSAASPVRDEDAASQNAIRGSSDEHTCGGGTRRQGIEAALDSAARLATTI